MSAAILQGVPATTIDTELWVDLPERQYVRLMAICLAQGGTAMAPTLYGLADGSVVNFLFTITGLRPFPVEYARARRLEWNGIRVRVLPVERILKSKLAVAREKDLAHIPLLRQFLKARRRVEPRTPRRYLRRKGS